MNFHFKTNLPFQYDSRIYFVVFFCMNILLTYFSWSVQEKLWLLLLGFFLPLLLVGISLRKNAFGKNLALLSEDSFGVQLSWIWISFPLAILAVALRIWKLGSLDFWPSSDESLMTLSVIQWMDHLQWKPFVISSQVSSTLSYLFYFGTKITGSFLLGIQLPSILVSIVTLILVYLSARQYFSLSMAWF